MVSDGRRNRSFSMATPALCVVASSLHKQPDASNAAHQKSTLADARRSPTSPRTPPLQFCTPVGLRTSRYMMPLDPKGFRGRPVVHSEVTAPPNNALLGQSEGLSHGSGVASNWAGRIPTMPGLQLPKHDDDAVCCKPSPIPSDTLQFEQGPCLEPLRLPSLKQTVQQDIGDREHVCCQLEQKEISQKGFVGCGQSEKSKPSGAKGCKPASVLDTVASDTVVLICGYIEFQDIVRFSTVCPVLFDERAWQQLHLVRYGRPRRGLVAGLPLARASRLRLQSDFPIHHARLTAIRHHHCLIRSTLPLSDCDPRLTFALETLTREDKILREEEAASWLDRADVRRRKHTTRTGALRELAAVKRANTEERMAMVDMRSAVERHAYAPGRRPHAPQASSWRGSHGGRGKALGAVRALSPSLVGVFCDG